MGAAIPAKSGVPDASDELIASYSMEDIPWETPTKSEPVATADSEEEEIADSDYISGWKLHTLTVAQVSSPYLFPHKVDIYH
jgi:hypothetical protein